MHSSHRNQPVYMNKLVIWGLIGTLALTGCKSFFGGKDGELTGSSDRPTWDSPEPYGMVLVPAGSYHLGQNDQDVNYSQIATTRQITVSAFWMDDTEITNNEWRQFAELTADQSSSPATLKGSAEAYDQEVIKFLFDEYGYNAPPAEYAKLVIPDTAAWVRDFGSYTYNEPIVENYYWHPAFDDYPVIGVSWYGAQAFAYWRTLYYNKYRDDDEKPRLPRFRLPSEAEWEFAARGGLEHKLYPWEGLYLRNAKGCFLANFKNQHGDYIGDNYSYTSPVRAYWPNDFGLYDMSGNVAEWCEDDFEESAYTYTLDLNPVYRDPNKLEKRRVVRGGSWKDIAYFLSVGTRDYEYADLTKSYIGLRLVNSVIGAAGSTLGDASR